MREKARVSGNPQTSKEVLRRHCAGPLVHPQRKAKPRPALLLGILGSPARRGNIQETAEGTPSQEVALQWKLRIDGLVASLGGLEGGMGGDLCSPLCCFQPIVWQYLAPCKRFFLGQLFNSQPTKLQKEGIRRSRRWQAPRGP